MLRSIVGRATAALVASSLSLVAGLAGCAEVPDGAGPDGGLTTTPMADERTVTIHETWVGWVSYPMRVCKRDRLGPTVWGPLVCSTSSGPWYAQVSVDSVCGAPLTSALTISGAPQPYQTWWAGGMDAVPAPFWFPSFARTSQTITCCGKCMDDGPVTPA